MEENRDEILANFQACTGIDDVSIAITHLEDTDWDLARAVNRAIPDQYANRTNDSSPDVEMIQEFLSTNHTTEFMNNAASPPKVEDLDDDGDLVVVQANVSKSSSTSDILKSIGSNRWHAHPSTSMAGPIHLTVDCMGNTHKIEMPPYATVLELKKRIEALCTIKICQQSIMGWNRQPRNDSTLLNTLGLGSHTRLHVKDNTNESVTDEQAQLISDDYILIVTEENSGKCFTLKYPGSKSIQDVKIDLHRLTNIATRHQQWTGWPATVSSDSLLLGYAGLSRPEHILSVKMRAPVASEIKKIAKVQREDSEDSSVEEFEDAAETFNGDDDMFLPDSVSRKLRPLIPDKVDDETVGCLHFADEFVCRFGQVHPEFFLGSLDEAIKEACMKPAKDRRLLALYLHHDRSVLSNVFCTQLMCSDSIINIFATYFVLWAWDLTLSSNQQRFINSLTYGLGSRGAAQIKSIPVERLPAIVIINRVRSNTEILSVIQGNVGIDELTTNLSEIVDVFMTQKNVEIREEEERTARETIKQQQDAAFQESLEMDRAKEEARRHQEQVENKEKIREMQQREHEAAQKEAERLNAESRLPVEPSDTDNAITKIRVRIPQGQPLERRFNEADPLQTLFDWLLVQGYRKNEIKLLSSWPRRDLTGVDPTMTLKELSLCPQETVILEER